MTIPALVRSVLDAADVRVDGSRPWDLKLHDPAVLEEVLWGGSLAFGDAYVKGRWDCDALDGLFTRLLSAHADQRLAQGGWIGALLRGAAERLLNLQSLARSTVVARRHYDIHPAVYTAMLDSRRIYSCGYWERAGTLEEAQEHKLRLICRKLQLAPGQHLLDIGCGWGGLAAYAAEHYGVSVVGITLSTEQLRFAQERWKGLPLSFHLCDYRKLGELLDRPFDRIVSVGMYEHVGPKNGRTFFRAVRNLLSADGLFLLHTIGYRTTTRRTDPWIDTHVFRHGRLPSPQDLGGDLQSDFLIEDWHNFGPDYDRTLMAWWRRFEAAWPSLSGEIAASRGEAGAEEFHRFWRYYLLCCAGFFRSRQGQLWQLVLSRADQPQHEPRPPYRSIRPDACALRGEAVLA